MNVTAPKTVAARLMPRLVTLVEARKQARWQWKHCADENKHKWTQVVNELDCLIATGENLTAHTMDITTFHYKRVIVE